MHTLSHICMHLYFTCMYIGVRATDVFFEVLVLDNYLSHILTEPGKCTVFNLVFELFKISSDSNFPSFVNEPMHNLVFY